MAAGDKPCILLSGADTLVLSFQVKFYPSDPEKLREELTRCVLYADYDF